MRLGELLQPVGVAPDQDRIGHHPVAILQRHAALVADRADRADQVLVHAHAPGDAVHDDAEPLLRHGCSLDLVSFSTTPRPWTEGRRHETIGGRRHRWHSIKTRRGSRRRPAPATPTCISTIRAIRPRRPRPSRRPMPRWPTISRCGRGSASRGPSWCSRRPTAPTTAARSRPSRRWATAPAASPWSIRASPTPSSTASPRPASAASASICCRAARCRGTSWRRWRRASATSAGTCSFSSTAAPCPTASRC